MYIWNGSSWWIMVQHFMFRLQNRLMCAWVSLNVFIISFMAFFLSLGCCVAPLWDAPDKARSLSILGRAWCRVYRSACYSVFDYLNGRLDAVYFLIDLIDCPFRFLYGFFHLFCFYFPMGGFFWNGWIFLCYFFWKIYFRFLWNFSGRMKPE